EEERCERSAEHESLRLVQAGAHGRPGQVGEGQCTGSGQASSNSSTESAQWSANDMSTHTTTSFSPSDYGLVVAELLVPPRLAPLGPGSPNRAVEARLRSLKAADLFAPRPVVDADMAAACLAGLWLYHDFLDESHTLSQEIDTTSGSYWHAILHRREPDASNSKYWWRQVGNHPVFVQLAEEAARLGWRAWDPVAFVDACEKERGSGSEREMLLREAQR